jgi:hypothetical protein
MAISYSRSSGILVARRLVLYREAVASFSPGFAAHAVYPGSAPYNERLPQRG